MTKRKKELKVKEGKEHGRETYKDREKNLEAKGRTDRKGNGGGEDRKRE